MDNITENARITFQNLDNMVLAVCLMPNSEKGVKAKMQAIGMFTEKIEMLRKSLYCASVEVGKQ